MKYFKTKAKRTAKQYEITPDNFQEVTKCQYPFEQHGTQGQICFYGICPSCLNPIQLIGILHQIKTAPYGKHTGKNISGFPAWKQEKYEYCPFSAKNDQRKPEDGARLEQPDASSIELYNLIKSQFDRIVYVIENALDLRCSKRFWEKVLQQFLINKGCRYPWLTEANLPYIFAYIGMRQQRLYMQKVRVDSDLYHALKKHPNVDFVATDDAAYVRVSQKSGFLSLTLRFYKHKQKASDGEMLQESMRFCVDDMQTGQVVFESCVAFDSLLFMHLVLNEKNESKRQHWLLKIAEEHMPTVEKTTDDFETDA